jgi:DNA-binding NtrC family response regulator
MSRVLIVDDETNARRILSAILRGQGCRVVEAEGVKSALESLESSQFDLVITDQNMRDGKGLEILAACRDADPALPVVMLTAFATVDLAVEALRGGAFDFLTKPYAPEVVRAVVERGLERVRLARENRLLRGQVERVAVSGDLLGDSPAMMVVRERIALAAPTNATVLITGETGTGKEVVARAIHRASERGQKPFVPVNCAAFTETLLDSELFGHERGAFTGAEKSQPGWFEAADGGTLFLDEAGEMSSALQAKLLRVLTDRQVVRVGSRTPRQVDVRIILATHRDLQQRMKEGQFREDLYYRVAVVPIAVPPLRDRREDIAVLVEKFLHDAAIELKVQPRPIDSDAMRTLEKYHYPGNIRELRNLIERACILATGPVITASDFPIGPTGVSADLDPIRKCVGALPATLDAREVLERFEKELLCRALEDAEGVQAEAARRLNLTRGDVGYKIRKYQIALPGSLEAEEPASE